MYSKTVMYLGSRRMSRSGQGGRYWGRADGAFDRLLLAVGTVSLVLVVPSLWIWLLYGSGLGAEVVYAGGVGLCILTAAIGFAMIRILDGDR
jgi:hypothetical protein